ncbi:MAG: peptidoglycan DD-metalloendopeptidase family protein [Candidatus Midichloria sp.]|nr:peptidoglycan DD-metalloendopeptidase family protein [Candidatus Midichloria sp.]
MHFLFRLDKYHLALFVTIIVSLTYNVIFWGSSVDVPDSTLLVKLLTIDNHTSPFINNEESTDVSDNSHDIEQYSKIKKEDGIYKIILEEGDNLEQIFTELQIDKKKSHLITSAIGKIYKLTKLRAGEEIQISFLTTQGQLIDKPENIEQLLIDTSEAKIQINYSLDSRQYHAKLLPIVLENRITSVGGKITNSFFHSAQNSGLSRSIAMDFINIFSHQIDFQRDLEFGSKFKVVHEYQTNDKGKKIKDGRIMYASLQVKDRNIEVYMHEFSDGTFGYFNKDGSSIKKALLRTPVKSATVSSGFGMRKHPILGYSRMHRGLDYAAPRGTPVIASGDGVIEIMKYHSNYGRYVKIKHNKKYSTLYAHLDRFSSKFSAGSRVRQGEVIGYVGSTGMSTGPHLHYEVHVDGKQVNPAKIAIIPKSLNLEDQQLVAFKAKQTEINKLLNENVALAEACTQLKK